MQAKTIELKQLQDFVSGASPRSPHHSQLELDQSEACLRLKERERRVAELETEAGDAQARVSDLQRELGACQAEKRRATELDKQVSLLETKNRELGAILQTRSQHIAHLEASVAELTQLVAGLQGSEDNTSREPQTPDRTPPAPDPILERLSSIVTSAEKMCTGGQGSSSLAAAHIALLKAELKEKSKILSRQREQLSRMSELNPSSSPLIPSWLNAKEREVCSIMTTCTGKWNAVVFA